MLSKHRKHIDVLYATIVSISFSYSMDDNPLQEFSNYRNIYMNNGVVYKDQEEKNVIDTLLNNPSSIIKNAAEAKRISDNLYKHIFGNLLDHSLVHFITVHYLREIQPHLMKSRLIYAKALLSIYPFWLHFLYSNNKSLSPEALKKHEYDMRNGFFSVVLPWLKSQHDEILHEQWGAFYDLCADKLLGCNYFYDLAQQNQDSLPKKAKLLVRALCANPIVIDENDEKLHEEDLISILNEILSIKDEPSLVAVFKKKELLSPSILEYWKKNKCIDYRFTEILSQNDQLENDLRSFKNKAHEELEEAMEKNKKLKDDIKTKNTRISDLEKELSNLKKSQKKQESLIFSKGMEGLKKENDLYRKQVTELMLQSTHLHDDFEIEKKKWKEERNSTEKLKVEYTCVVKELSEKNSLLNKSEKDKQGQEKEVQQFLEAFNKQNQYMTQLSKENKDLKKQLLMRNANTQTLSMTDDCSQTENTSQTKNGLIASFLNQKFQEIQKELMQI